MRMTRLSISNYRALRDVSIPMSRFGCLIGENNSGKSSFLQALSLFFSGSKLSSKDYFDESRPIRIEVVFENIEANDLARLVEEHRTRVSGIIKDGCLTLVRSYGIEGKSSLLYNILMTTDERFSSEKLGKLLKGQRPGPTFVEKVTNEFPEIKDSIDTSMNQEAMRQKIQDLADSMPDDQKVATDIPLPTGIDKSIIPMLPDPIYIPAVKDLADDIKTTEGTPFGKILAILLQAVETKLPDAQKLFEELNSKLNRVQHLDGTLIDDRLEEVKLIESTVEKYVRDSFSDVALRITIPPPELKTVFSSARIYANDGVDGLIETKGDGLRRAIVFSILRSYVELNDKLSPTRSVFEKEQVKISPASYMLLFEEPELFLHPKGQSILFDALRVFARDHHVLVTTHSPMFFGPNATETFIKLHKKTDPSISDKPFTQVQPVDLMDMTSKDQFQIICFENNNAAFFADTVVLVEGDSDYLLFPHIAKTLNPAWNIMKVPIHFARITGKGNIRRYREFFRKFDVRVPVIADLDLLLNGFHHVSPSEEIKTARDNLLVKLDGLIEPETVNDKPTAAEARKAHDSVELRGLWKKVQKRHSEFIKGKCTQDELNNAVDVFFAWQHKSDRLAILMNSDDSQILQMKWQLLEMLRNEDVYILERGSIENYYPDYITGSDKPSRAEDFCVKCATREAVLDCCIEQEFVRDGELVKELEFNLIFGSIFKDLID